MSNTIKFEYHNLQSCTGQYTIKHNNRMYKQGAFYHISVQGNYIIIYEPDNGKTDLGRMKFILDLRKYEVEFI